MNAEAVVDKLITRVPFRDSWVHEPWGAFNVPNKDINRVLYCVTPTKRVVQEFRQGCYDLLVSHHPYRVPKDVPHVILHTALDCVEGGMNDQWRDAIGIKNAQHFDDNLGWYGEIEPTAITPLIDKVTAFVDTPIGYCYSDIEEIRSVVVCSGLGGMVEDLAFKTGADCYILGQAVRDPSRSKFPAMIETGHTISEYKPGLKVIKDTLEPEVSVTGASLENDYFGDEIWRP